MPSQNSFDEYVVSRGQALVRFAYVLCGDRHLAEDLVQEVLIRAYRRWSGIEAATAEAYLKRALVRAFVSWRRRRSSAELVTSTVPDRREEPVFDDAVGAREESWALLATLPPAQRTVLVLRYFEDLDDRRIAQIVGSSEGAVKAQAHRALRRLRDAVALAEPSALPEVLGQRADQAPAAPELLETVRHGAAAMARRRRAAIGGIVATIVLGLVVALLSLLRPGPAVVPVQPSPSTSDLVRHSLSLPTFPYSFGFEPAGTRSRTVSTGFGATALTYHYDGGDMFVWLQPEPYGWMFEGTNESTATVGALPATLRTANVMQTDVTRLISLTWPRDGQWVVILVVGDAVAVGDVLAFANSMSAGITGWASSLGMARIISVALPDQYEIYGWDERGICALPPQVDPAGHEMGGITFWNGLCITVEPSQVGERPGPWIAVGARAAYYPGVRQLAVGHQAAFGRPDGVTVLIRASFDLAGFTYDDLVAIYRGVEFA